MESFPTDERDARLLLGLYSKFGPVRFARLVARFGSAAGAFAAPERDWASVEGIGGEAAAHRRALSQMVAGLEREKSRATRAGARWITALDAEYPASFRELRDAPPVLYLWGSLKPVDSVSVALVGTRHPSPYGRAAAERLARELTQAGVPVVSGLARGIDTAAHTAALEAGGRTIGILGSGLAAFYPRENRRLAERMAASGAVVTEFPLDAPPDASHFPRRNRLIAALALGTVVVEAREKSGALITAHLAAEQGKDVFAVPGSIFSPGSRGPHRLLNEGARLVESAEDLLGEIRPLVELVHAGRALSKVPADGAAELSPEARRLLAALDLDPAGIDAVARRSGLPIQEVTVSLLTLELAGFARQLPGKQFVRSERSLSAR